MTLRINTNVTALTAHKNLEANDANLSKSIERLSSGLRINTAGDDAAGLAISEKLRTQVRGITQAVRNVQDGISLLQTAEGAMNEVTSMLQRMRELALQASTETLTSTDRLQLQNEINQLKEDINRISSDTEFNTRKLLDGSGTAQVSTSDPKNLTGLVTGPVQTFTDFSVIISPQIIKNSDGTQTAVGGTPQIQRSGIFTRTDGTIATGSTTLLSISNFYDDNGVFILDVPQNLIVQGDNHQGTVIVDQHVTLDELATRIQTAMLGDQLGQGLGFPGSTATLQTSGDSNGQIEVTSGKTGKVGSVTFNGQENLMKALAFGEVKPPTDPTYIVKATNLGDPSGLKTTTSTDVSGNRAAGLIAGMDLLFTPPTSAMAESKPGTLGVIISPTLTFSIHDSLAISAHITLAAGTYGLASVAALINTSIASATPVPSILAKYITASNTIEFYSTGKQTGSAGWVSVICAQVPNSLNVTNTIYKGSGGSSGIIDGTGICTFPLNDLAGESISIIDDHNRSVLVTFTAPYNSMGSIANDINTAIGTSMSISAYDNNGVLEFKSSESGPLSHFIVKDAGATSALATLNLPGAVGAGCIVSASAAFGGDAAIKDFPPNSVWGINLVSGSTTLAHGALKFSLSDLYGQSTNISIPAPTVTGTIFVPLSSIATQINNNCDLAGENIRSGVNTATGTLQIFSTIPGTEGKVAISDIGTGDNSLFGDLGIGSLGVNQNIFKNGLGEYAFTMHVKDAFIQFQIGPNQGHTTKANIIRTDTLALGIDDLNVTNVTASQAAIEKVDQALQMVLGERAKLGAIQNRMDYTTNSLNTALQNVTASESRIRDVDMASEVIQMTRNQVLTQASNSMLAQANATSQNVLNLLK
ncbi:MAG: hypothetical protein HQM08_03635 [Candidatus Riflebacteria bacterium]|nr:hypothetical protein [Candidatus Riflebacteria bacterium]